MTYQDREPKQNKKMKGVLQHVKKISKAELRLMISTNIKEMVRDEMRRFLREESYMNELFREAFRESMGTSQFNDVLERLMARDTNRINRLMEDLVVKKAVKQSGYKKSEGPTGRSRSVKL